MLDTYEVIVILDGCGDRTGEVVERIACEADHPVLHTVVLAARTGVGHARRLGMDLAHERLLALGREDGLIASTDADTVVADDWLATQMELVRAGASAVGG